MNTNKKKLIIFSLLLIFSVLLINALPLNVLAETTTQVAYVGENFCSETSVKRILVMAGYILIAAKILVPFIIIVMGTIDFYKAVVGGDASKEISKQAKNLGLRLVLGVFIFFIPNIVDWTIGLISNDTNNNTQCIKCVLEPGNCDVDTNS